MNEMRSTMKLSKTANDYLTQRGWLGLCVEGLRRYIVLPNPAPLTIDLVFTKRRRANSFALAVGNKQSSSGIGVRAYRGGTYGCFDDLLGRAWRQGYRYVRVEYDD